MYSANAFIQLELWLSFNPGLALISFQTTGPWWPEMSSDDNRCGSTWHLQLVTFVHISFSPPLLLILIFQPSNIVVTEGHYSICRVLQKSVREKKQSRAIWLCGKWHVKGHTCWSMCIVLIPCFCFASSVCFGSFESLILSGFARDRCRFPSASRRLPVTKNCSVTCVT